MNLNKIKQFFIFFFFHFLFLIVTFYFVNEFFLSDNKKLSMLEQIRVDSPLIVKNLPLIFYFLFFVFIFSFVFYVYLSAREWRKDKKIEDALKLLNEGHYSAAIFLEMFSEDAPSEINPVIDREFLNLHEKMILISEEAVNSAQQKSQITKESKEKIIEIEKQRIARELHDSVSQQLFAAAMLLSAVEVDEEKVNRETAEQIKLVHSIIDEAQSEMRALLLHLRPVKLDGRSLKRAIESLLKELSSKIAVKINYEIDDIKLTEVVEDHLFRMIQELLSNVLRHSEAKELEVYLKKTENFYRLRFIDDGKGFDIDQKRDGALGLTNIKERIESLGGNFHLVSIPDEGTSVEIRIPLITGRNI